MVFSRTLLANLKCDLCKNWFQSSAQLKQHVENGGNKNLKCAFSDHDVESDVHEGKNKEKSSPDVVDVENDFKEIKKPQQIYLNEDKNEKILISSSKKSSPLDNNICNENKNYKNNFQNNKNENIFKNKNYIRKRKHIDFTMDDLNEDTEDDDDEEIEFIKSKNKVDYNSGNRNAPKRAITIKKITSELDL